jgi:two-component system, OmpR family, phosphate regulon sensor histidine kinase PhoR|tara:strand:- start:6073 stop:7365 length:1293 start_codon:yes stop_codon:yes gene_type:complete
LQDIRWSTFWFFFLEIFLYFLLAAIFNEKIAVIAILLAGGIYISSHLYWIYKLNKWIDSPNLTNLPNGTGVWINIFAKIYRSYREQKKSKTQLTTTLDHFIMAAEAMNDGIVAINESNEILWSNKKAQKMLSINPKKDNNQPINYIFRNTEFINYLEKENYTDSINIENSSNNQHLEIKVANFGSNQKLVTCRDTTEIKENEDIRKEFVSNFSHELKTPLTVISGFLETLEDRRTLDEDSIKIVSMMSRQAERMKKLIEDLLLLSNVESSASVNRSEKISTKELIKKLKIEVSLFDKKKHKISYIIDETINIYGSRNEIFSAYINLITNAIRYTNESEKITISWGKVNSDAVFEVTDSGIGISSKHLSRITERFYRVDEDRSRDSGGTGLGLSIVKNVMLKHQGEIKIMSEPNKGSSFKLVFPSERIYSK